MEALFSSCRLGSWIHHSLKPFKTTPSPNKSNLKPTLLSMFLFDKIMLTITYDRNWNHQYKIKGGRRCGARWRHKSKLNSLFVSRFTFHSSWFPNPSSVENKLQKKLQKVTKSCTEKLHFCIWDASYAFTETQCIVRLAVWLFSGLGTKNIFRDVEA